MNNTLNLLKHCNITLDRLATKDYRFVAWIIYSAKHKCFIAGVDMYANDEENSQTVIAHSLDIQPFDALDRVYMQVEEWNIAGAIPLDSAITLS